MANNIEKYIKFWKDPFSTDSSFMIIDVPWIGAVKRTGQAIHSKIQGKLINDNNVLKMVIPTVLLVLSNNSTLSIDDTITEITKEKIDELLGNINKSNVKSVVIGEFVKTIGHDAFNGFSNLETVAMTDSVTRIEASAFSGCTKLVNNIPLSKKIEYIGDYAFQDCSSFSGKINLQYLTYIGNCAFKNCKSIQNFKFSEQVTYIGEQAFYGCESIESFIIPEYISYIYQYTFADCTNLSNIQFSNNLLELHGHVFDGCKNLQDIKVPNGVEYIGNSAFAGCENLNSIFLPKTITTFEYGLFNGCPKLMHLEIDEGHPIYESRNSNAIISKTETTMLFPNSTTPKQIKKDTLVFGCAGTSIPDSVTHIAPYAFYNNSGLSTIEIPNSVEDIGEHAFSGCTGLYNVSLGSQITIGNYAFSGCSNLGYHDGSIYNLKIDGTVGNYAFQGCTNLRHIEFDEHTTSIGQYAFQNCQNLCKREPDIDVSLYIPETLLSIGQYAFTGCKSIEKIVIQPSNVSSLSIGNYAFQDCSGLVQHNPSINEFVVIPDERVISYGTRIFDRCAIGPIYTSTKMIYMGADTSKVDISDSSINAIVNGAFQGLGGLENIILPKTLTTIGERAFYNCSSLNSIDIPNSVNSIGYYAFYNCKSLKTVLLSNNSSFKTIQNWCFYGCTSLENIGVHGETGPYNNKLPSNIITIGQQSFMGCSSLQKIDLTGGVTTIQGEAFRNCSNLTDFVISTSLGSVGINNSNNILENTGIHVPIYNDKLFVYMPRNNREENIVVNGEYSIPDDISIICHAAFKSCADISTVIIPSTLSQIQNYVFSGCTGLNTIGTSDNIQNNKVIFDSNITTLGAYAFNNCKSITDVSFNNNNSLSIGDHAFYGCSLLNSVKLPDNANNFNILNQYVFYNCSSLKSINIPNTINTISEYAFQSCSSLESIIFPTSLTTIGNYAFYACSSMHTINNQASSINSIGTRAFQNCSTLESLDISNGKFNTIKAYTFANCHSLSSVLLPPINTNILTNIEDYAFGYCDHKDLIITIPTSVGTIADHSFQGVSVIRYKGNAQGNRKGKWGANDFIYEWEE